MNNTRGEKVYYDIMITKDGSIYIEPWKKELEKILFKNKNIPKRSIKISPYCG